MLNYFLEYLSEEYSSQAATGWNGDKYVLYEKDNSPLLTFITEWDSRKDAREFFQNYLESVKIRYADKNLKIINEDLFYFEADAPDGKIYIKMKDKSVNVIEGKVNTDIIDYCMFFLG